MNAIQTILHPTDFSEAAEFAYHLASSLARDHQARLVLLHVAPPPYVLAGEMVPIPAPMEEVARELMTQLKAIKPLHLEVPLEYRLLEGDAVEGILKVAEDEEAGLIVLGTHGRTGLGRLLLGSVAEQVLRRAPCPVLTVKKPGPVPAGKPVKEVAAVG